MVFSFARLATPNAPSAASVHVVPLVDVSRRKSFGDPLRGSPHGFDGSIAIPDTLTATGSLITISFGTIGWLLFPAAFVIEPHPLPRDWSIIPVGPQPKPVKSGGVKLVTAPPPDSAAQSRRSDQSSVLSPWPIVTVLTDRSYPGAVEKTFAYVPTKIFLMSYFPFPPATPATSPGKPDAWPPKATTAPPIGLPVAESTTVPLSFAVFAFAPGGNVKLSTGVASSPSAAAAK